MPALGWICVTASEGMVVTFHVQDKQETRDDSRRFVNVPLSGWCIITDKAGREYYPVETNIPGEERPGYFYFWEKFTVDLKMDVPYTVRVGKGLGWNVFEETLTFQESQTQATIQLNRWINLSTRRWLAGDLETSFKYMDPSLAMDSQGINLVCRVTPSATATTDPEKRAKGFNHLPNERGFTGRDWKFRDFNVLGTLEELVVENETPFENTDIYHIQKGKKLAGFIDVVAAESPEIPVAAALGCLDFFRVVGPEKSRDEIWDETRVLARFESYYDTLNAGFHVPVSAGSLASEDEPDEEDRIGASRVYARVLGTFSLGGFLGLLKKGPSWATNGPMVSLMVNKKDTGMEYEISPGRSKISISMGARSDRPIDRLELIHNGKVVDTLIGSATEDHVLKGFLYEVTEPGWISVRVLEKPIEGVEGIRYAHSSPVYLKMANKLPYQEETVKQFLQDVETLIGKVEADEGISPEEKREILIWYREAKSFYENRLKTIEELEESI